MLYIQNYYNKDEVVCFSQLIKMSWLYKNV